MKSLLLILSACCLSFGIIDPCLLEVRQVFDKLNEVSINSKEVSYLNYTVISTSKDAAGKSFVSKGVFEMISTSKQNRIYSKDMIVLKDQSNTFTIMPSRKMIYISDAVIGKKDENLYDKLKILQDTIFKNTTKVDCESVKGQLYNKIVTVFLNDKLSSFIDIKKASYYINSDDKTLKKVFVEYVSNKQFETIEYVFNETNFDYKKADMSVPVRKLVYENNTTLKKEYESYKVIDNRKK